LKGILTFLFWLATLVMNVALSALFLTLSALFFLLAGVQ
jgi:succinate-acetate transporter protein